MGSGPSAPLSPVRLDAAFLQKVVTFLHAHDGEKEFTNYDSNKKVAQTMHATYCVVEGTNGTCSNGSVDVNDSNGFMMQVLNLAASIKAYSTRLVADTKDNDAKASALARHARNVEQLIHLIQAHKGISVDINKQLEKIDGSALQDAVSSCRQQLTNASTDLRSAHDKLVGGMDAVDFCVEQVPEKDIQKRAATQQCYSSALALPSTAIAKAVWDMQQSLQDFDKIAIRSKKALEGLHTVEAKIKALKETQEKLVSLNDGQISSLTELIDKLGPALERCRASAKQFQQQLAEQVKKLESIKHANATNNITASSASSTPAPARGVAPPINVQAANSAIIATNKIKPIAPPPAAAKSAQDDWRSNDYGFNPFAIKGGCSRRSSPSRSKAARRKSKSKSRSPRSRRRIGR
jgi:hypothetical protein